MVGRETRTNVAEEVRLVRLGGAARDRRPWPRVRLLGVATTQSTSSRHREPSYNVNVMHSSRYKHYQHGSTAMPSLDEFACMSTS